MVFTPVPVRSNNKFMRTQTNPDIGPGTHGWNQPLETLPWSLASLPRHIEHLHLSALRLTHLPQLPSNLQQLMCSRCNLSRIPRMPNTMIFLHIWKNPVAMMENIPLSLVGNSKTMQTTPIFQLLTPIELQGTHTLPSLELFEVWRQNLRKLNRFRELYYTLKYKARFWDWLWIKVRLPRIERAHHPDRLRARLAEAEREGEEADFGGGVTDLW